jgi:hypothetical protein
VAAVTASDISAHYQQTSLT